LEYPSNTKLETIELSRVNLNDKRYIIPCNQSTEKLVASIREIGIINAPHCQETDSNRLIPVLGYRRLCAAAELGWEEIQVRVIGKTCPEPLCFEASFRDNISHRPLDPASRAWALKRLTELFPMDEVVGRFLDALDLPPQGPRIQRTLKIAELGDKAFWALANGRIHERTAYAMAFRTTEEQNLLMDVTNLANLNRNKSSQLIESIIDIAVLNVSKVESVLEQGAMERIAGISDPRQRAKELMDFIFEIADPDYHRKRYEHERWVNSLNLPANVSVAPAESFEDPSIRISIRERSMETAKRTVERLLFFKP
jgi:hypothetical protein